MLRRQKEERQDGEHEHLRCAATGERNQPLMLTCPKLKRSASKISLSPKKKGLQTVTVKGLWPWE
jgi:hypothetical protein